MSTTAERRRPLTALLAVLLLAATGAAQTIDQVKVGHWIRVKGHLESPGIFIAEEIEVREPAREESIVATPTNVRDDGQWFDMLGLPCNTSARTEWDGLTPAELGLEQIEVEGHYRGPRRFSVRDVEARNNEGRDRIEGRLDQVQRLSGGFEFRVMSFRVLVDPKTVTVECDKPIQEMPFAEPSAASLQERRDDEDEVLSSVALAEGLTLGGRMEIRDAFENEYDLGRKTNTGEDARGNGHDRRITFRAQAVWEPTNDFFALLSAEEQLTNEHENGRGTDMRDSDGKINEAFGFWRFREHGFDLQAGRQDFDDLREWIYDETLDGVRGIYSRPGLRVELSASTGFGDKSRPVRETDNYMLYVSNNDDREHLAAYVIDRRRTFDEEVEVAGQTIVQTQRDKPIHFGLRALGEWLPDQTVWAEAAVVRGYRGGTDYDGWGVDLGTTWAPADLEPVYLTLGWARTSGDSDPNDEENTSFQQTGLQDNNGNFGGLTSFRYYGEVFEPELSNMSILTFGVGARVTRKTSLDLVAHKYDQVTAAPVLSGASNLRNVQPNGNSRDLGWGVDLILGSREWNPWDIEVIVGTFHPGSAFAEDEDAWLGKLQLRYRF